MFKEPVDSTSRKRKVDEEETLDKEYQLNESNLKKITLQIEKLYVTNVELRDTYPKEPEKWMDNEIELDATIKRLGGIAAHPELYSYFVKIGGVTHLLSLFTHPNQDIVNDVIDVLREMVDPDSFGESDALILIKTLFDSNIISRLVTCIYRMNNKTSEEEECIHDCLEIIENLLQIDVETTNLLILKTNLIEWLLKSLEGEEFSSNKLFASEILATIVLNDQVKKRFESKELMDALILVVSKYRKSKPNGTEEKETMKNIFDALSSLLMSTTLQDLFAELEGIELLDLLIRERKFARSPAGKALTYATVGNLSNCERLVKINAYKTIFPLFLVSDDMEAENVTQLLFSLFRVWDEARFIAKFVEKDFEKTDRLMEFFVGFYTKLVAFEEQMAQGYLEELYDEVDDDVVYLEKINHGLQPLQQIVHIFTVIAKNEEIKERILLHLQQRGLSVSVINELLQEYNERSKSDIKSSF